MVTHTIQRVLDHGGCVSPQLYWCCNAREWTNVIVGAETRGGKGVFCLFKKNVTLIMRKDSGWCMQVFCCSSLSVNRCTFISQDPAIESRSIIIHPFEFDQNIKNVMLFSKKVLDFLNQSKKGSLRELLENWNIFWHDNVQSQTLNICHLAVEEGVKCLMITFLDIFSQPVLQGFLAPGRNFLPPLCL